MNNRVLTDIELLSKSLSLLRAHKNTEKEDIYKLEFFDQLDNIKDKDKIFEELFEVVESFESNSANGFVSLIQLRSDKYFKFILKTPKSRGGDDPEIEYKVSKFLTRKCVLNKKTIPRSIAKTWASIRCVPNYVAEGTSKEKLGKYVCKDSGKNKKTHIIMEYIKGDTFFKLIRDGSLNSENSMKCLNIILNNLAILRQKTGFTHYDLHLGNIMIEKGEVKTHNLKTNKESVTTVYQPIIIDFGRTYIKPFTLDGETIDLSKQKFNYFVYSKEDVPYIFSRFKEIFIDPLTNEIIDIYKLESILTDFTNIKIKNTCDGYNLKEKNIIMITSIIFEYTKARARFPSSLDELFDFMYETYYTVNNKCLMDVSPLTESNINDALKVTMSVLDMFYDSGFTIPVRAIYKEILVNFPFLLPGQNFLPLKSIKNPLKNTGLFCLDTIKGIMDIISSYSSFKNNAIIENKIPSKFAPLKLVKPTNQNRNNANDVINKYIKRLHIISSLSPMSVESVKQKTIISPDSRQKRYMSSPSYLKPEISLNKNINKKKLRKFILESNSKESLTNILGKLKI